MNEEMIPLRDACRLIPGRPHRATVWRWAQRGIVREGRVVRLATITCGARRYTTPDAVEAFVAECSAGAPTPTVGAKQSRHQQAAADLAARGI